MNWEHERGDAVGVIAADGTTGSANRPLPAVLDPVVTLGVVQRYVEAERIRTRRFLFFSGTVFLAVILFILVASMAVGIVVVRTSRRAAELAEDAKVRAATYATEVLLLSNAVGAVEGNALQIRGELREIHARELGQRKTLETDLERFGQWVALRQTQRDLELEGLKTRLREFEGAAAEREKALAELRARQEAISLAAVGPPASGTGAAASVAAAPVAAAPPDASLSTPQPEQSPHGAARGTELPVALPAQPGGAAPSDVEPPASSPSGMSSAPVSVVAFPNGERYEGQMKDGLFHGWGVYLYRHGDRYEGEFLNDMKHGRGTLAHANGEKYVGEFKDDMKCGRGAYTFRDGTKYVGEFRDDLIQGRGTMNYANGNSYSGEFHNGMKHGNGRIVYANGDSYTGEFSADSRHGRGTYAFSDGAKYIGEYRQDKREGKGRFIYASGEEFIGEFHDGKMDGYGVCKYPNGQQIKGLWKSGRLVKALDGQ